MDTASRLTPDLTKVTAARLWQRGSCGSDRPTKPNLFWWSFKAKNYLTIQNPPYGYLDGPHVEIAPCYGIVWSQICPKDPEIGVLISAAVREYKMIFASRITTSRAPQRERGSVRGYTTCAIGIIFFCGNAAFAQTTLSSPNGYVTIGGVAGNYRGLNDDGAWQGHTVNGALHFPLGNNLNVQVNGRLADYTLGNSIYAPWDAGEQNALSAAVFWRDPSIGLVGAFSEVGEVKSWHYDFTSIGLFSEVYPNDFSTIGASVTSTDSNTNELNTAITSKDLTYEVWAEYFVSNNTALRVSAAHQVSKHNFDYVADWSENIIGISGEYFLKELSGADASITAGYYHANYSDSDRKSNDQIRIGLKWYFGHPASLNATRRKGAVEMRYNSYIDAPRWWQFPL